MTDFLKSIANLIWLWKAWNLRGFVLFSFSLQCILILGSQLRIQTLHTFVHRFLWLVYLLADWAAYYGIGLIIPVGSKDKYTYEIHAFWAPFLLLHIGGPNNIAGFNLQDNELWDRSVLHIVVQAGATAIVIYRSLPMDRLLAPTLLMLLAALTRYVGRILALHNASSSVFQSVVQKERIARRRRGGHTDYNAMDKMLENYKSGDVQMVFHAYKRFQKYKGIFGGLSFKSSGEICERREHLLSQNYDKAFTEMEIELALAYDLFYTKIWLIFENKFGWVLHLISLISEVATLVLWILVDKRGYHRVDVRLTNTLLMGGVVVDVVSILKLAFSDLSSYHLMKLFPNHPVILYILNQMLLIKKLKLWGRPLFMFRRWSRSISQFNLDKSTTRHFNSLHSQHRKTKVLEEKCRGIFGIDMDVSTTNLSEYMLRHIFDKVKSRVRSLGRNAESREAVHSVKFGGYLSRMYQQEGLQKLLKIMGIADGMLLWHITTNLFYQNSKNTSKCSEMDEENKQISDYLMYLLFRQPKMVLEGVVTDITVEDMIENLQRWKKVSSVELGMLLDIEFLFDVESISFPAALGTDDLQIDQNLVYEYVKGREAGKEFYLLHSIYRLSSSIAEQLGKWSGECEGEQAKQIINEVWTDYLLYASIHCKAYRHVQRLGKGGELLTLVWLFMSHVGLNIKFEDTDSDIKFEDTKIEVEG